MPFTRVPGVSIEARKARIRIWYQTMAVVLAVVAAAVPPARGQGLLEAIGDAIEEAMEESVDDGYDDGTYFDDDNSGPRWNDRIPSTNGNSRYQRVWNGSYWELVPLDSAVDVPPGRVVPANVLPYRGPGVTIVLDHEVGGTVTYVVDGRQTSTIQAGQQQTLTTKGKYEVRFSRGRAPDGRDFGEARYTVTEGTYHFTVTDKGWELYRDKAQPGIISTNVEPSFPTQIQSQPIVIEPDVVRPMPMRPPQVIVNPPFVGPRPAPAVDSRLDANTGQDRPVRSAPKKPANWPR